MNSKKEDEHYNIYHRIYCLKANNETFYQFQIFASIYDFLRSTFFFLNKKEKEQ